MLIQYIHVSNTRRRKIGKLQVVATAMWTGSIAVSMKERVKAKLGGEKMQTASCISAILTDSKHFLPHDQSFYLSASSRVFTNLFKISTFTSSSGFNVAPNTIGNSIFFRKVFLLFSKTHTCVPRFSYSFL